MNVTTIGDHHRVAKQLSQGLRSICRRPPGRWQDLYPNRDETLTAIHGWLATIAPTGTHVTWVPGHDASPGPGHLLAAVVADTWNLPLVELIERSHHLRSAFANPHQRPTAVEQRSSLRATTGRFDGVVVLVDNTIATGATISAAVDVLAAAEFTVGSIVAVSTTVAR